MANLGTTFDASTVSPQQAYEPIPAGWYNALIDHSEMRPTKDGSGAYLQLRFNIIDGDYANRKIFARLNLNNRNETAVAIAQQQLSAICHATGVMQVLDSEQLHGRPMQIKVKYVPANGNYEASNDISGYRAIGDSGADIPSEMGAAPMAAPQAAPTAAPAASYAAPQPVPAPAAPMASPAPAPTAPVAPAPAAPAAPAAPVAQAAAPSPAAPVAPQPAASTVPPWAQPAQA